MRRRRRRGSLASDQMLRPELLWRILCYGALILVLASAECSFFARLSFLSVSPDLLLGATVAVALLDGRRQSLIFACAAGLILDAVGGVGIPLSAAWYFLIAAWIGALGEKMLPRFGSYLVLLVPSVLIRGIFGLFEIVLIRGNVGIGAVILRILIPEAIVTLLLALPLYGLVKLCMLPFREKRR